MGAGRRTRMRGGRGGRRRQAPRQEECATFDAGGRANGAARAGYKLPWRAREDGDGEGENLVYERVNFVLREGAVDQCRESWAIFDAIIIIPV